jgi:hypothetical protein
MVSVRYAFWGLASLVTAVVAACHLVNGQMDHATFWALMSLTCDLMVFKVESECHLKEIKEMLEKGKDK